MKKTSIILILFILISIPGIVMFGGELEKVIYKDSEVLNKNYTITQEKTEIKSEKIKEKEAEKILSKSTVVIRSSSKIRSNTQGQQITKGTGFIHEDFIITSGHVVKEKQNLMIYYSNGKKSEGKLTNKNKILDIAIIKPAKIPPELRKKHLEITKRNVRNGDKVYMAGKENIENLKIKPGSILNKNSIIDYKDIPVPGHIMITRSSKRGYSGGPIIDKTGKVVGMIRGKNGRKTFAVSNKIINHYINIVEDKQYIHYTIDGNYNSGKLKIKEKEIKGVIPGKNEEIPKESLIISVNNERIANKQQLLYEVLSKKKNKGEIKVTYIKNGKEKQKTIKTKKVVNPP